MSNYYNRQWRLPNAWNGTESNVNKSNYSMDFNNVLGIETSLDVNEFSQITFSFWFKTSAQQNSKYIISMPDGAAANGVEATFTNTSVRYRLTGQTTDTSIDATFTYYDDNWHHIVCTYDGSTQKIYVDGALSNSGTANNGTLKTRYNKLYIGSFNWVYGLGPDVTLDGVSIFNYALSSSQVTTLYGSSSTGIGNPMSLSPAPVAYYPLGDQDAFNGSNYLVPNSSLKDYVFDFSSDLIDSNFSLTTGQTQFSASIWVKFTGSLGNDESLIANESGYSADGFAIFKNASNTIQFKCESQSAIGTTTIALNKWYLATATYNAGAMVLYVNGQQEATQTTATSITQPSTPKTRLGKYITGNVIPFTGELSNAQIFNTALSSTDVETLYNNGSPLTSMSGFTSLQGWWKLDASATYDSSTTTWTIPDDSTNSNDGTSSGMTQANLVQSDLSFKTSISPFALAFDGANDRIVLDSAIQLTTNKSISAWCYVEPTVNQQTLLGADVFPYYWFWLNSSGSLIYIRDTTNITSLSTGTLTEGWTHFCITGNGTTATLYINGASTSTGDDRELDIRAIGGFSGGSGYNFNGKASNISIWNAALTSSQVLEIYNEGVPSNLNNHSAYSNLVSWWQLGSNSSFSTNWTVLDEKGSNNGTSANMTEDDIVDGVGSYANGTSSGMGGDEVIGDAPYSTANSLSVNMDVLDRTDDTPA